MKVIKETDPDLYKYILQKLQHSKGASLLEDYLKDKKEKASTQELFDPQPSDFLDVPSFLEKKDLDEMREQFKQESDDLFKDMPEDMREDSQSANTRELDEIRAKLDYVISILKDKKFLFSESEV